MKTEQEQRRAIRQILFDANDICQATPCENEYCIYHGDYRCYDNVIVDKLIRAGYGDVSEYKAEIERLRQEVRDTDKMARNTIEQYRAENEELENALKQSDDNYSRAFERLKAQGREIKKLKEEKKRAQIDVLNNVKDVLANQKHECLERNNLTGYSAICDCEKYIDELINEVENEQ